MAHIGSSQSERRKFGLDQSESRISPMWLIDVTTIVLGHVTFLTVNSSNQSERSIV